MKLTTKHRETLAEILTAIAGILIAFSPLYFLFIL